MWKETLKDATERAGGMSALARTIGIPITTLQYWLGGKRTPYPAEYTIPIEGASGIPRHKLRPDIYGHSEAAE